MGNRGMTMRDLAPILSETIRWPAHDLLALIGALTQQAQFALLAKPLEPLSAVLACIEIAYHSGTADCGAMRTTQTRKGLGLAVRWRSCVAAARAKHPAELTGHTEHTLRADAAAQGLVLLERWDGLINRARAQNMLVLDVRALATLGYWRVKL